MFALPHPGFRITPSARRKQTKKKIVVLAAAKTAVRPGPSPSSYSFRRPSWRSSDGSNIRENDAALFHEWLFFSAGSGSAAKQDERQSEYAEPRWEFQTPAPRSVPIDERVEARIVSPGSVPAGGPGRGQRDESVRRVRHPPQEVPCASNEGRPLSHPVVQDAPAPAPWLQIDSLRPSRVPRSNLCRPRPRAPLDDGEDEHQRRNRLADAGSSGPGGSWRPGRRRAANATPGRWMAPSA